MDEQLFLIALKCGCVLRLYREAPPRVEERIPHSHAECLLPYIALVAGDLPPMPPRGDGTKPLFRFH